MGQSASSSAKFANPKIVGREVNAYAMKWGLCESGVAKELRLETAKHNKAIMMGDPLEASLFGLLLPAINAKNVVEVGVFTGYTTLVMAQALPKDGKVVALDVSTEFTSIGKPYWKKAGVDRIIDLRIGPASDSLQEMLDRGEAGKYDFAFVDADKPNYLSYYEKLLQLIRPNGILAIDNVLWSGKVLLDDQDADENTLALKEISKKIANDDRVEHVMLPFADGVTLVRKL